MCFCILQFISISSKVKFISISRFPSKVKMFWLFCISWIGCEDLCAIAKKEEPRGKLRPFLLMIFKWLMYFWNQSKSCYPYPLICPIIVEFACFQFRNFLSFIFVRIMIYFMASQSCIYVTKMYFFPWTCAGQDLFTCEFFPSILIH